MATEIDALEPLRAGDVDVWYVDLAVDAGTVVRLAAGLAEDERARAARTGRSGSGRHCSTSTPMARRQPAATTATSPECETLKSSEAWPPPSAGLPWAP